MGEKISDYINSASATPNNQSLFDLSEFDGSSYESVKWELSDFITWITNNVSFSEVYTFHNNSGATLEKGTPVKIDSLQSGVVAVNDYQILPNNTSSQIFVAKEQILNGAQGVFFKSGIITDVDTSTFSVGQTIYYNYTTNAITNVYASDVIYLGIVITSAVDGSIFVAPEKAEMTDSNIYSTDGTLTGNRIMDGANNELLFQTMGKFSVHSHANNIDNVVFEVRSQAGYESFTIRDHNTGDHLFCVENGKVEINNAYFLPDVDGSANRVIKTDGAGQWGYGVIQDNGTTAGIGATPDANKLLTMSTNLSDGIVLFNTNTGAGTIKGLNIITQGASSGTNIAVYGSSSNSTSTNIGAHFVASGTNPYSVQLQDGTEANGRFLSCDANGRANWVDLPASSGGILGISDSSGAYTYYSTLALAMAGASSGDTIELFADIDITTTNSTTTYKDGVKINGNGHTITMSVDDNSHILEHTGPSIEIEMSDITLIRTGRTNLSLGDCFSVTGTANAVFKGVRMVNTYRTALSFYNGTCYGVDAEGYYYGIFGSTASFTSCRGKSNSNGYGIVVNSGTGKFIDCIGETESGQGLKGRNIYNSTGIANTSGQGINAQNAYNCTAISNTSYAFYLTKCWNCNAVSVSSNAYNGCSVYNSTGLSTSGNAVANGNNYVLINSYFESSSNYVLNVRQSKVRGCTIECKWNNAGGHALNYLVLSTGCHINNNTFIVANSGAYCITSSANGSGASISNNSFVGSTTPINDVRVSQEITNTSDSQGNILN